MRSCWRTHPSSLQPAVWPLRGQPHSVLWSAPSPQWVRACVCVGGGVIIGRLQPGVKIKLTCVELHSHVNMHPYCLISLTSFSSKNVKYLVFSPLCYLLYSLWFAFELNSEHATVLFNPHFPSTELSVQGPETDSLITSNMAPMYPAFKGETAVQMVIGSWFLRKMRELKMPKLGLLRGFSWAVSESFLGEWELNNLINSGAEEIHGTKSRSVLLNCSCFLWAVIVVCQFSSAIFLQNCTPQSWFPKNSLCFCFLNTHNKVQRSNHHDYMGLLNFDRVLSPELN